MTGNSRAEIVALIRAYADENLRIAGDTILHDPVFHPRGPITPEAIARSEKMSLDGAIHSAKYHAAMDILALIGDPDDRAE